jgi:hypothetical protein
MGVDGFFINFNTKLLTKEDDLHNLMNTTLAKYGHSVRYNYGPNGHNFTEHDNIIELRKLTDEHVDMVHDFLIPADTDEFHDFGIPLRSALAELEVEEADYVRGSTSTHISMDGCPKAVTNDADIFEQFPRTILYDVKPKVSLFRASFDIYVDVGHHMFPKTLKAKRSTAVQSVTHHFKYNLQGKARMQEWIELMKDETYGGWKGVGEYEKELAEFSECMVDTP